MRRLHSALAALSVLVFAGPARAQETLADLLSDPAVQLSRPADRARVVARMAEIENNRRDKARAKATAMGLPLRTELPGGRIEEIAAFDGDQPVYHITHNVNAAISTGANLLRTSPYSLSGSGITIGLWDGGSARSTHQEFGGRVTVMDGASAADHSTHVGGTLIAAGVNSSARGMADAATIDSYEWTNDTSEMTSRGATYAGEPGKIYLSNHSYGYITGWNYIGTPSRMWEWWGNGSTSTSIEQDFGVYNSYAQSQDALAYNAPYYLIFRSAGNDRADNPSPGDPVGLSPGGGATVSYDPAVHPAGDGTYRGGFDTIAFEALAKNIMTIGSAADAVTSGLRDPSKANVSYYSCWGPTDDGRIKPDVVANGEGLFSSLAGSNSSYGTYSGTSMASPNACGSASLLIQQYGNLFPSQAMRASTLKGLLIHTADDRGNPGPDYKYGWGLVNVKDAADLISDHFQFPEKQRITESNVTTSLTSRTVPFVWDGASPIRATLCWTDPAGSPTTSSDSHTSRLVNNLNLKLIAPNGSEYFPYVMPFVGTWTQASMDLPATTGINNTDNVEQVLISNPAVTGTWQAVVSFSGSLSSGNQNFSLILSAAAAVEPPPLPLTVSSVSPASSYAGPATLDLSGTGFQADTAVKLARAGHSDITASSVQLIGSTLRCQFDLTGAATGSWDIVATNPDLETSTLAGAFTVTSALWSENFDGPVTGWTSQATTGTNNWSLTTAQSQSPITSYFAPGPGSKSTCNLTSPAIAIPADATNLQLSFWHSYDLESTYDCGKLEFSVDGGSWFDVTDSGSGASFASNGYTTTMRSSGNPNNRNEFAGEQAWSGNSNGFIETIVNLTDTAQYAGHNLQIRWRIASDVSVASNGWYVDSIALIGDANTSNQPPAITSAATTSSVETETDPDTTVYQIVRSAEIDLSVTADDDGGEPALSYTWSVSSGPAAPVVFTPNGSNGAKNATAIFQTTGDYLITVFVTDAESLAITSSVNVRVLQTEDSLTVSPVSANVQYGNSLQFSATLLDQFGTPMASQPSSFGWSASGGGTIDSTGLFNATAAGGPYVISAVNGAFSNTASVTVTPAPASVTLGNLAQTYDGSPKPIAVTTNPPDLSVAVTYNTLPSAPTDAGTYAVEADIIDPNYQGGASDSLVISKASQSITFAPLAAASYGDAPFVLSATATSGLTVSYVSSDPSVATVSGDTVTIVGVGSTTITASQAGDANHEAAADVPQLLTVNKATATVTLGDLAQTYDGNPKLVTATTTPTDLTVSITYDGSPIVPTDAGTYPVIATIDDPSYQGSASDTLVISQASQTITFAPLAASTFGDGSIILSATATSGLAVAYASSDPSVATVAGDKLTIVGAGSTTITASQTGDTNYLAATDVPQLLTVNKATATVTLGNLTQTFDGNPKPVTATTNPADLTLSVTYDGLPDAPSDAGSYAVIATIDDPNYQGSASDTLVIEPGNDLVSWTNQNFTPAEQTAGLAAESADPDFDGLKNLAEYALGTDPHGFTALPDPTLDANGLTLTFTRPANLPGISYFAESSDGLGNWTPVLLEVITPGDPETVRARDPLTSGDPSKRFLRLRIESP